MTMIMARRTTATMGAIIQSCSDEKDAISLLLGAAVVAMDVVVTGGADRDTSEGGIKMMSEKPVEEKDKS